MRRRKKSKYAGMSVPEAVEAKHAARRKKRARRHAPERTPPWNKPESTPAATFGGVRPYGTSQPASPTQEERRLLAKWEAYPDGARVVPRWVGGRTHWVPTSTTDKVECANVGSLRAGECMLDRTDKVSGTRKYGKLPNGKMELSYTDLESMSINGR